MENRRGSGIFLGVIGVATLLVAIIGATFAYFSATARSGNEAIAVGSTKLALGYKDDTTKFKTNMIPSTYAIAHHAATDATWIDTTKKVNVITGKDSEGKDIVTTIDAPGQCIDQNGNEICSFYEFYVGNPSKTTNMDIVGTITAVTNDFTNLKFAIYDEAGTKVVEDVMPSPDAPLRLTALDQTLLAYDGVENRTGDVVDFSKMGPDNGVLAYNEKDPSTYQPKVDMSSSTNAGKKNITNVRHYTMLIWINETSGDQTEADSGKVFAAGISFTTGGGAGGVTGVISLAADQPTNE